MPPIATTGREIDARVMAPAPQAGGRRYNAAGVIRPAKMQLQYPLVKLGLLLMRLVSVRRLCHNATVAGDVLAHRLRTHDLFGGHTQICASRKIVC